MHFLIEKALGKGLWRLASTLSLGLVLYSLGCASVSGVFIFALTSRLAGDLFFLLVAG